MIRTAIFTAVLLLSGCDESYDERMERLENAVKTPISSSGDYWIIKGGDFLTDQNFKVGLIFGYGDNELICREMIEVYQKAYRSEKLSCRLAN
ncbi:hypothetical protein [Thalassospira sp. GB04J01]|uniref:hypothetical protein n=1 Tax=Thalassospira sp. GB04J01 TaxID=1485225 RepID=UPI000C9B0E65|nr:hypothetical protein [Thalassospira sp. GB04J01]